MPYRAGTRRLSPRFGEKPTKQIVMKTMKKQSLVLLAAIAALSGTSAYAAYPLAAPYTEDFSTYLGSAGTLPANFIADYVSPSPYQGAGDGSGATINSGFWAFTNSGGTGFGILEGDQGTGDLSDSRLFLQIINDTGAPVYRLKVTYKVQIWRDGPRRNSIRLKYNTSTGGFSSLPDLASTPAKVDAGGNVAYDGNDPAYYTDVTAEFNLPAPLADTATAYLRWQYSTESGSGRRDGLGITDIRVEAVAAGTDKTWGGVTPTNTWNLTDTVWGGGAWSNSAGYNAVFNTSSGTDVLTLAAPITAVNLDFNTGGYIIDGTAPNVLTLNGRVDVATGLTATITAPIGGANTLLKTGDGILQLGGANVFTGTLSIAEGTVRAIADDTLPTGATVQLGDGAVLDLNGHDVTIGGLQGDALGNVIVPSGSVLTIDTTGNFAYKGNVSGAGDVVKSGTGRQRFRNQPKTYTGATIVENGTLEFTENATSSTSSILVLGNNIDDANVSELLLTSDPNDDGFSSFTLGNGDITLNDGQLAVEDYEFVITNDIALVGDSNGIYVRGAGSTLSLDGVLDGTGGFRKQGQGDLYLYEANSYTGPTNIRNGRLIVEGPAALGTGPLLFTSEENNRYLELYADTTVSKLDGNSPDPDMGGTGPTAFIYLEDGVTLTVDQAEEVAYNSTLGEWEETTTRFQGDIEGEGNLVKTGKGYLSLTRWEKTLSGAITVSEGVLDVSAFAKLANVTDILVEQGGQLRISSNVLVGENPRVYDFGAPVRLRSTQRASGVDLILGRGFGILGGLRYNPGAGAQAADLQSDVVVEATSDIHVDGSAKVLYLSGTFSGSGDLIRTGGGALVFTGTASGYTGDITIDNGLNIVDGGVTLGTGIDVTVNVGGSLGGGGSVGGSVTYAHGSFADFDLAGGNQTFTVSGDVTIAPGGTLTIRAANASATRTVTISAAAINATGATVVAPGAASVSVGGTAIVVTY